MIAFDLFNLDSVYNKEFSYSLPRKIVEQYTIGLGFDNKEEYTKEEQEALRYDIQGVWDQIQARKPSHSEHPTIVLTAGAPGAGKTTVLRRYWEKTDYAYICPDDVCLKQMKTTYGKHVEETKDLKGGYHKWRAGSNYGHHLITAHLIRENTNFFYGTTASSDKTAFFLKLLKERGYTIEMLHISAPDDVRHGSLAKRDQVFVQHTSQDAVLKELLVHERIQDTFLKYADKIDFFYRAGVDEAAVLSATWERVGDGQGTLAIHNPEVYQTLTKLHDTVCEKMKRPDLMWSATVEKTLKN